MQKSVLSDEMQFLQPPGSGSFKFSAIRPENLGATEYTLVTIVLDTTGSVATFADELLKMVKSVIDACKKSPRAENLLLRFVTFDTAHGIVEKHGFKLLSILDMNDYKTPNCNGMTPLWDATFDSINAALHYSQTLKSQDFSVNGAIYIITDGDNNASTIATPSSIRKRLEDSKKQEVIESLITVLIGINTADCKDLLEQFKDKAGLTQFVDVSQATPQRLAKLAAFVSKSISSQSTAVGSGSPSQPVTF
jgi:hypothetical protein